MRGDAVALLALASITEASDHDWDRSPWRARTRRRARARGGRRHLLRALEDLALEVVVAEVEDRVPELDTRAARE